MLLSGCNLSFFNKKLGLMITSNPQADVLIDGKSFGKTPYFSESLKAGSYTIRLTTSDSTLSPYETKVELTPGYTTLIDRQFGKTQDQSTSYILSFEKISNKSAVEVKFITNPGKVSVAVDNQPVGFSDQIYSNISAGEHTFDFSSPGFRDLRIRAKTFAGQRLVVNMSMATEPIVPTPTPTPLSTPSATPTPTKASSAPITPLPKQSTSSATLAKPYVEILSTPTGWLKVREKPSASSAEIAKVNPGDKFPYKEASASGWLQIEYQKGLYGYVSGQYAKLVQ